MNCVQLCGNLTRDPEVRFTSSNTAVCKFSLAVTDRYKDKDGEWVEHPNYIDCTVWGKRGEAFAKFHKKGSKALVNGALKYSSWEDKETGKTRSKVGVTVLDWHFAGGKKDSDGGGRQENRNATADADDGQYGQTSNYGPEDTPF